MPGIGKILSLVILYEIHGISRFARPQDLASYGRLVKCAKESAGKVRGTAALEWTLVSVPSQPIGSDHGLPLPRA